MKKIGAIISISIILLIFISLNAIAQETPPSIGIETNPAETMIKNTEGIVDEGGNLNLTRFKSLKERVDEKVNWTNTNLPVEYIFGMKIELSWTFSINILLMFLFGLFLFWVIPKFNSSVRFPTGIIRLFTLAIFIILLEGKFISGLSRILGSISDKWWGKAVIILAILALISLIFWIDEFASKIKKRRDKILDRLKRFKENAAEARKIAKEEVSKSKSPSSDKDIDEEEEKDLEKEAEEEAKAIAEMANDE